jgi:hypothetical protein
MRPFPHPNLAASYSDAKDQIEDNFRRLATGVVHGKHLSHEIPDAKLLSHWDEAIITLQVHAAQLAAGWPATSYVDIVPQLLFDPNYRYSADMRWVCTDPGAGTGTVIVREMRFDDTTAAWTGVGTVASFTLEQSATGGATNPSTGIAIENAAYLLSPSAGHVSAFGLYANAADATALTSTGSFLRVEIRLKQHLRSA